MASIKQLNKKITSLKSTHKITRAMKMIAATKLRKAQQRAESSKPYTLKLTEMLSGLSVSEEDADSPLLFGHKTVKKIEALIITSDRGLCGPFNANIIKKTMTTWITRSFPLQ